MEEIKGHLVLLMAPSGSGKKTLIDSLGELQNSMYFAKTYTSRQPREGAAENPKYEFISKEQFEALIQDESLVEWAEFGGNLYGTPKAEILDALKTPQIVFKEMELQGVQQIKALVPSEHVTVVYIDAGTWEELKARIIARAPISDEELALRQQRYEEEIKFKDEANIIVSNRDGEMEAAKKHFTEVIGSLVETLG